MFGPDGDPDKSSVTKYTLVPYEDIIRDEMKASSGTHTPTGHPREPTIPHSYTFTDERTVIGKCYDKRSWIQFLTSVLSVGDPSGDVFDESNEVCHISIVS